MKKICFNILLLVMLIAVMNFHALPKMLHEIIGVVVAVAIAVHIRWNFRSLRSLPKFYLAVDALMLAAIITITVTGVILSNHIFNGLVGLELKRSIIVHQLHHSIPFVAMILIGLHLGRNWSGFHQRLKNFLPINPIVEKILAVALIITGIVGVYMDQLPDRLMMHHIFGTPATQLPHGLYALIVSGMIALFTAVGVVLKKVFAFANKT